MTVPFDTARFETLRRAHGTRLGHPAHVLESTGSTNDDAASRGREGAPHGTLVLAEQQTRGRGRRGHAWTSPPGENLTFSILLRPSLPASRVSTLTLVAGAAVRAALAPRIAGNRLRIKWPNDVVADRRKVAGILVESQLSGTTVDAVVVGIGINVHMRALPDAIEGVATSLALLGDPNPDRESVLADVLAEFEPRLAHFEREGLAATVAEVRRYDALHGHAVSVEGSAGTAEGIAESGALLIRTDAGRLVEVASGTVSW